MQELQELFRKKEAAVSKLRQLERSISLRALTSLNFGKCESLSAGWVKPAGTYDLVFRIKNESGDIQDIPENKVPPIFERPPKQ
jgi:hypothetical protein